MPSAGLAIYHYMAQKTAKSTEGNPNIEMVLMTETGYLMLVKSFTDDLAWQVQRILVNAYFRVKATAHRSSKAVDPARLLRELRLSVPKGTDLWPMARQIYQQAGIDLPETLVQITVPTKPASIRSRAAETDLNTLRTTLQAAFDEIADRIIGWKGEGPWKQGRYLGMLKTQNGVRYIICEPHWFNAALQSSDELASKRAIRAAQWLRTDKGHSFTCNVLLKSRGDVRPMIWVDIEAAGLTIGKG